MRARITCLGNLPTQHRSRSFSRRLFGEGVEFYSNRSVVARNARLYAFKSGLHVSSGHILKQVAFNSGTCSDVLSEVSEALRTIPIETP